MIIYYSENITVGGSTYFPKYISLISHHFLRTGSTWGTPKALMDYIKKKKEWRMTSAIANF